MRLIIVTDMETRFNKTTMLLTGSGVFLLVLIICVTSWLTVMGGFYELEEFLQHEFHVAHDGDLNLHALVDG